MRLYPLLFGCLLILACQPTTVDKEEDGAATRYGEAHRNQYHFSPDSMWMNDPNGMVYYEGEYHLFYQYYPDSTVWGPMHWGHAVSTDLVEWEHLPIALYPDSLGYIFSGSAVIDWNNTSGFGNGSTPPMIAIFTHHDSEGERAKRNDFQYQSIAYSLDRGRSWTKYANNPVVPNPGIRDFRDPKVIWDDGSQQWIMVFAAYDHVKIYGSPDLKSWVPLSDFGREWGSHAGVWECPDFFPITMEDSQETYWVMIVSVQSGSPNGGTGAQYFVGDFNGKDFKVAESFAAAVRPDRVIDTASVNESERTVWVDYGRDNYAGVTWSDVPAEDGRRIFIGWMSNWQYALVTPTERWRSAMTLPRALSLAATGDGLRLRSLPVEELDDLETKDITITPRSGELTAAEGINQSKWSFRFDPASHPEASEFVLELSNDAGEKISIGYEVARGSFFTDRRETKLANFQESFATDRHDAPRKIGNTTDPVEFTVYVDHASIELVAEEGLTSITDIYFAASPLNKARVYAVDGNIDETAASAVRLRSIW